MTHAMTEREVSSERDDAAFLRGMALAYATDDNEHSQKGAARLREIADNILALRSSVKTVGVKKLEWRNLALPVQVRAARTPFGDYRIGPRDDGRGWYAFLEGQSHMGPFASEDAAIAAAQTDYERRILSAIEAPSEGEAVTHPDDIAVDRFAAAMKAKLAKKRGEGRGGWERKDECTAEFLSQLLREHVEKGDPIDVGNLAMMLQQRGERITK